MEMNVSEILDRWSICKLKVERIGDSAKLEFDVLDKELKKLEEKHQWINWQMVKKYMYDVNDFIWQLEAGLKSGKESLKNPVYILDKENEDALIKIGTATLIIRNFNHLRVSYKNFITKLVGEGFQDMKKEHCSE